MVGVDQGHRLQRVVVGQGSVGQRDEGLDAVGQRVEPGGGVEPLRHGDQQPGIDDGDVRDQRAAHDRDLGVPLGVGDDAELRDVGARPRRGRHHDQRGDRVGDPVDALVVQDPATVAGQQGHALGRVDHRAAAQAQHDVAARGHVLVVARLDLVVLRVRRDAGPQPRGQARLAQVAGELVGPARLEHAGIGDQEGAPGAEPQRRVRRLAQ
jgi:hypothetical protein